VAQEALTNVARHAQIDHAKLNLRFQKNQVVLQVEDDGVGFNNLKSAESRGWGLAGMRERAESVGGELHMRSASGDGTFVEVSVPIQEATLASVEEEVHELNPVDVG